MGAKKLGGGLGATKVKKDFAEVEREAEMADQVRSRMDEEKKEMAMKSQEEQEKAVASMRLAYQDLSVQQKKQVYKEDLIHVFHSLKLHNVLGGENPQDRPEEGFRSGKIRYGRVG